jgi:hypothetical protein
LKALSEDFVKQRVVKWLTSNNWGHLDFKQRTEHGVDIKARHNDYNIYYFIEAKGDPDPKKVKHPGSVRDNNFLIALGQILTRMETNAAYHYGIALPQSYEKMVYSRIPWQICKRLRLKFLLVAEGGKVDELTWKDIKKGRH